MKVAQKKAPVKVQGKKSETKKHTAPPDIRPYGVQGGKFGIPEAPTESTERQGPHPGVRFIHLTTGVDLTEQGRLDQPAADDAVTATLNVSRADFLATLKVAGDFIGKKATLPVLQSVYLGTTDTLNVIAYDLERGWHRKHPLLGGELPEGVCIPHATLIKEVAALPDTVAQVELKVSKGFVTVNDRCRIYTLPGSEYPVLPTVVGDVVTVPSLLEKFRKVLPAAGQSDTRYVLNAVCLDLASGKIVATDGHRLHFDAIYNQSGSQRGCILIPTESAKLLVKHGGPSTFVLGEHHLMVQNLQGGLMVARLTEGTYPSYDKVIPSGLPTQVTCFAKELLQVIEGALPIVSARSSALTLRVNGGIVVEASNPDIGRYSWTVPCKKTGDDVTLTVNAQYLADAVKAFTTPQDDAVLIEIGEPLSAILINDHAVVMPMRL